MTSQLGEMLATGKRAVHQPTPWGLFQVFLPYPEPLSVTLAAKPEISSRYHGEVGVGLQAERQLWTGRLMEVAAWTYSWRIRKRRRKGLGMQVACKEEMQEVKKGSRPAEVAHLGAIYRPPGRPPARWRDQIERDMGVPLKEAEHQAQGRPEWRRITRRRTKGHTVLCS